MVLNFIMLVKIRNFLLKFVGITYFRIMKKPVKITVIVLSVLVVLFLAVTFGGGAYMVKFALQPDDRGYNMEHERAKMESRVPGIIAWWDAQKESGVLRDTFVVFPDGRRMHAQYMAAAKPTKKTAILVHGYQNNPTNMCVLARMYREDLGYNVFLPGLYGHGLSAGDAAQMGWLDRLDMLVWIPVAHELFDDESQVVHGFSMGAATTMMLSGEPTPDYVKCFIEDAGYSDVWNMYKYQLKEMFGLPPFPILYGAEIICKLRFGWSFHEASSVKQLAKCEKPMFFIHGGNDDFVPTAMLEVCYAAKTHGYKEIWEAPGSIHVFSNVDHPEEYLRRVSAFLDKVGM